MTWRKIKYHTDETDDPGLAEPVWMTVTDIEGIPPEERTREEQALLDKNYERLEAEYRRR